MKVLILASNRTLTLSLLRALTAGGHTAYVLASGNYPVIRACRACVGFSGYDKRLLDKSDTRLAQMADRISVSNACDIIMPSGIEAVAYLASNKASLKQSKCVPLASAATISLLNDKWLFASFACAAGVNTPRAELVDLSDLSWMNDERRQFPLIIKPTNLDGSRGVHKVISIKALADYVRLVKSHGADHAILQEYIPGDDLSISILADQGVVKSWSVHTWTGPEHDVQFVYDSEIVTAASQLVAASKFHGLINFDFRRNTITNQLYVIECNPRPWASIHIAKCAGIDFPSQAFAIALGQDLLHMDPPSDKFVHPERAIKNMLLGRTKRSSLSAATLAGIDLDRRDIYASFIRLIEKHVPGFIQIFARDFQSSASTATPLRTQIES